MASFPGLSQMDHDLVRSYVVAADHVRISRIYHLIISKFFTIRLIILLLPENFSKLQYSQLPDGIVAILMTHSNLPAKHLDIRLDLHSTVRKDYSH